MRIGIPKNCSPDVRRCLQSIASKLDESKSPTFASFTLSNLTASSLVGSNASKALESVTIGTGLNYTRPTLSLSHLGIEDLTDPGADRILFWDDSGTKSDWLTLGNSLVITTTTLDTIQDIRATASPTLNDLTISSPSNIYSLSHDSFTDFVANEHIDWTSTASNIVTTGSISGGTISITNIKSGATQAGAGAAANEIWKTSSHATLPDNVLLIGV